MFHRLPFSFLLPPLRRSVKRDTGVDTRGQPRFTQSLERGSPLGLSQVLGIVRKLALDALNLGASEVFLGHPEPDRYEFLTNGKRYTGKIHPAVLPLLRSEIALRGRIPIELGDAHGAATLALTLNFERQIVCLTLPRPVAHRGTSQPTPSAAILPPPASHGMASQSRNGIHAVPEVDPGVGTTASEVGNAEILLVDDDPRFLSVLTKVLESKGYRVIARSNAREVLEQLERRGLQPDLIISDIHMPIMDGGAFLRAVRRLELRTPILVLTSDLEPDTEAELALLGANAFVRKQSDPKVLLAWCKNLISVKTA